MTAAVPNASEGQAAATQVTHGVTATATFASRTSLQVSSDVLRFHVTDTSIPAEATIQIAAGARTQKDADVLLVLDIDPAMQNQGATGSLTIAAGPAGTVPGFVVRDQSTIVARWVGGGLRSGAFTFRFQAPPGRYDIPVRLQLRIPGGVGTLRHPPE